MSLAPMYRIRRAAGKGTGRANDHENLVAQEGHYGAVLQGRLRPRSSGCPLLMVIALRWGKHRKRSQAHRCNLRAHVKNNCEKRSWDWPSYAQAASRCGPWFLLAAAAVGQAGYRFSMHGWIHTSSATASVREAIDLDGALTSLFTRLETLSPPAFDVLTLRRYARSADMFQPVFAEL